MKFSPVCLYFPPLNIPHYFRYTVEVAGLQLTEIQGPCKFNPYFLLKIIISL